MTTTTHSRPAENAQSYQPFPSSSSPESAQPSSSPSQQSWSHFFSSKMQDKALLRKYASLGGSILVALSAGSNYAFSSYAPQLSEALHLTATQLNIVGVLGNMGVYLSGPLWGKWVDKQGPKVALFAGAVLVTCGYGGLSFVYSHKGPQHSALAPALLNLCAGIGNCAAFTAAMNAQAKSFSGSQRGSATALVLAGFGLSAFMYSTLSHELFPGNTSDYLLLLAFGSAASFLAGIGLVKITPTEETLASATSPTSEYPERVNGITSPPRPTGRRRRISSSDLGAHAYVISEDEGDYDDDESALEIGDEERRGLLNGRNGDQQGKKDSSADHLPQNITGWKLLRQTDFRLLFAIMCLISGSGLLLINNVGTITRTLWQFNHGKGGTHDTSLLLRRGGLSDLSDAVSALQSVGSMAALTDGSNGTSGHSIFETLKKAVDENTRIQQEQAHQVSAISVGNASGRILVGFLSDLWVAWLGSARQRVWLFLPVTILAFSSQFLFALPETVDSVRTLLVASFLSGLMYGGLHGIAPCLTFEWFGLRHAARNWSLVALAPVISGNVFNLLFGRIFDSHVPKGGKEHLCLEGEECYRSAFVVTSCATGLSVVLACVLIARRAEGWPWSSRAGRSNQSVDV